MAECYGSWVCEMAEQDEDEADCWDQCRERCETDLVRTAGQMLARGHECGEKVVEAYITAIDDFAELIRKLAAIAAANCSGNTGALQREINELNDLMVSAYVDAEIEQAVKEVKEEMQS